MKHKSNYSILFEHPSWYQFTICVFITLLIRKSPANVGYCASHSLVISVSIYNSCFQFKLLLDTCDAIAASVFTKPQQGTRTGNN